MIHSLKMKKNHFMILMIHSFIVIHIKLSIVSDINECTDGTHLCGDKQCINLLGSYKCRCSAGFEFNDTVR